MSNQTTEVKSATKSKSKVKTPKKEDTKIDLSSDDGDESSSEAEESTKSSDQSLAQLDDSKVETVDAGTLLEVASPIGGFKVEASYKQTCMTSLTSNLQPEQVVQWLGKTTRPILSYQENVVNTADGSVVEVKLYGDGCLECEFLIPSLSEGKEVKVPVCHFNKGNVYCPAAHLRMRFVGQQLRLLAKLKKAQASQDVNRFTTLLSEIEGMDLDTRKDLLKEIGLFDR